MSIHQSEHPAIVERLRVYLRDEGYCAEVRRHYPPIALRFLRYLDEHGRSVETVQTRDVDGFLRKERLGYRKRNGRSPPDVGQWRRELGCPARLLLRLVHGRWPPQLPPRTPREAFHREILEGYDRWMDELRGLATQTREGRVAVATEFLDGLFERSDPERLMELDVGDIDAYIGRRVAGLRRKSIKDLTASLRAFVRYLHGSGRTRLDLSSSVTSPTLYTYEGIPSALSPEDVQRALAVTREDRTPMGLRDYAILMLLATYGLRAGEITSLRLDDIDWRKDTLHVRHSKTGVSSNLPLLREPGEALLKYLKGGRPSCVAREVFLRLRAPHRPFVNGSSLYYVARNRLKAAGIMPSGKKGPHTFRHARAVSLLRAAVSLKAIGDILGHRSTLSTGAYLKLAMEDLRAVALEVPTGVSP
jgi:integrase/recombinase XerD